MPQANNALAQWLAEPATLAAQRLRQPYNSIIGHANKPIILFGSGALGQRTALRLQQAGRPPAAFSDNNQAFWGTQIQGIPVLPPHEAVARYSASALFVVTIYNGEAACAQLQSANCQHVLPFASFYHGLAEACLPWGALSQPSEITQNAPAIMAASQLWADPQSQAEFSAQIAWRLGLPQPALPPHDPASSCYFPDDLFTLGPHDLVVDCGAFDGDSLRLLLNRQTSFGHYLGLEPDPDNHKRLEAFIATLPAAIRNKISTRPCAVAASNGVLRFAAQGGVSSGINFNGNIEVTASTLDDLLHAQPVACIKMDIEGAECDALRGAASLLRRDRPVLAISAYHFNRDLWEIPLLIKSILPDYQLYLRRYAEDCWEQICYALPPTPQART